MLFRAIFCLCFSFLMIGLWGCGSHHDKANTNNLNDTINPLAKADEAPNDTIINISVNGKSKTIRVQKREVKICLEIEKLASQFKNRPLDTTLIRYLDVTGDGVPEKIIGRLYVTRDSIFTTRTIYQNEKIIDTDSDQDCLNDTFEEDDMHGIFNDLSSLEPYASIQEFIPNFDIFKDTIICDLTGYKTDTTVYFGIFERLLKDHHVLDSEIGKRKNEFRNYVANFKGAALNSHDEMDEIPKIWYEPYRVFVELY